MSELDLATLIAEKYIQCHAPKSQLWDWEEAIMMFALTELYSVIKKPLLLNYTKKWMDYHILNGYKITRTDFCPPALTAIALFKKFQKEEYLQVVKITVDLLLNRLPRTDDGAIKPCSDSIYKYPAFATDQLFMFGMVLSRWGELMNERVVLNEFGKQIKIYSNKLLQKSGFYTHSWGWVYDPKEVQKLIYRKHHLRAYPSEENSQPDPSAFWGRGNAWVTVALTEYLRVRKLCGENDEVVNKILEKHLKAVLSTQDKKTGLWCTLLDRPDESYFETSASALFGYALALGFNNGLFDKSIIKALRKARDGIKSYIKMDEQNRPVVTGISEPTAIGNAKYYASIPVANDIPYGVGAVILFLKELSSIR